MKKKDNKVIIFNNNIRTTDDEYQQWNVDVDFALNEYKDSINKTVFKNDKILIDIASGLILRKTLQTLRRFNKTLRKMGVKIKEIPLNEIKKRKEKNKKLTTWSEKKKIIYVPKGFGIRNIFNQLINLQHKYKLLILRKRKKEISNKLLADIFITDLALLTLCKKAGYPRNRIEPMEVFYQVRLSSLI